MCILFVHHFSLETSAWGVRKRFCPRCTGTQHSRIPCLTHHVGSTHSGVYLFYGNVEDREHLDRQKAKGAPKPYCARELTGANRKAFEGFLTSEEFLGDGRVDAAGAPIFEAQPLHKGRPRTWNAFSFYRARTSFYFYGNSSSLIAL